MIKFKLWVVSFLTLIGLTYLLFEDGMLHRIWDAEGSIKISFIIMALALYQFFKLGKLLHSDIITPQDIKNGLEASNQMMSLGMIGTVTGFIIMTASFAGVDFTNVENIKDLFELATLGMSTALYTTQIGMITSFVFRAVYMKLEATHVR